MSDITQTPTPARHARLFELIRQRSLAAQINPQPGPVNPAEAQLFRLTAERSINAVPPNKLAS